MPNFQHGLFVLAATTVLAFGSTRLAAAQSPGDATIQVRSAPVYRATLPVKAPSLKPEVKPEAGRGGAIWVPGFWNLQGDPHTAANAGWVWVPGQWLQPPSKGARWDEAHWGFEGHWWTWIPGHWDESDRRS